MEDDHYPDFGNRSVPTSNLNQQETPTWLGGKVYAEMAVESAENTTLLSATEDIEIQHSEESGKAIILPTENIMPGRRPSDIARDTKRILEIAYGSEDSRNFESEADEELNDEDANYQSRAGGTGSYSYNETVELKEGQFIINGYVINPLPKKKKATKTKTKKGTKKKDSNEDTASKKSKKKKTTKKKKELDGASGTSDSTDAADAGEAVEAGSPNSESQSLLKTIDEDAEGQTPDEETKKPKKKKTKKKKKKKKGKKKVCVL